MELKYDDNGNDSLVKFTMKMGKKSLSQEFNCMRRKLYIESTNPVIVEGGFWASFFSFQCLDLLFCIFQSVFHPVSCDRLLWWYRNLQVQKIFKQNQKIIFLRRIRKSTWTSAYKKSAQIIMKCVENKQRKLYLKIVHQLLNITKFSCVCL